MEEDEHLAEAEERLPLSLLLKEISRDQRSPKSKEQAIPRPSVFADKQKRRLQRLRAFRDHQLSKLARKSAGSCLVPTFGGFTEYSEGGVEEAAKELAELYFGSEVQLD